MVREAVPNTTLVESLRAGMHILIDLNLILANRLEIIPRGQEERFFQVIGSIPCSVTECHVTDEYVRFNVRLSERKGVFEEESMMKFVVPIHTQVQIG